MGWQDLLVDENVPIAMPWFGSTMVHNAERSWTIRGPRPPEHGWYVFNTSGGRWCQLLFSADLDLSYGDAQPTFAGYVVGDRFIQDNARVDPDPTKLIQQTVPVFCVEPGLGRFTRAVVVEDRSLQYVYMRQEFPLGPEAEALMAFQDRRSDLDHVSGVTPALDLAFRWITLQRELIEERRRELARIREEEEQKIAAEEAMVATIRAAGSAHGRRVLAEQDFETAAREALRVSGAQLLDVRDHYTPGQMVVQYRFRERRLECVVEKRTLRITDAGVCLEDHTTRVKGDTFFTLESLPGVIGEAMDLNKLVVWR